jgi:radical SAM superfamily enzyme YgiQ (UPF0313 family)
LKRNKVPSPLNRRQKGGILLVNIPFYHAEAAAPPMGLASLAAVLEEERRAVDLLDAHALGIGIDGVISRVGEIEPLAIGLSVMSSMFASAAKLTREIKRLPSPPLIIWGGPHPTVCPEESLTRGGADICVLGEGERTIVELAPCLPGSSREWGSIAGIAFMRDGAVARTAGRKLIEDLDSLPPPAYHLLPMDRYATLHTGRKRFCSIMTSRGCPGKCMFCSRCVFGGRMRYRSVARVLDEIELLMREYRIEEISVIDDAFAEDRGRVLALCGEITKRGLRFAWRLGNGARVDTIDEDLMMVMRMAGCYEVAFGVESGDDEVLKRIGKEITTQQVREAFRAAHRAGLDTIGFFMIGHPFDTLETMKKTIDFAISLDPTYAQFTMSTPLPGTALWEWVERHGKSLFGGDVTKLDFLGATPHFETENYSREDAARMYRRAYRRFYLRPSYIWRRLCSIRSWNDLFIMLRGLLYLRRI